MAWYFNNYLGLSTLTTLDEGYDEKSRALWVRFNVNATSPVFEGHFPNGPVLPGVCLIDRALKLISTELRAGVKLSISALRLTQALFPNSVGVISAERLPIPLTPTWLVKVKVKGQQVARFEVKCENDTIINPARKLNRLIDTKSLEAEIHRLPHRKPVHLVDSAELLFDRSLVARRKISERESWLTDADAKCEHINNIVPIGMQIESFLQAGALLLDSSIHTDSLAIFGGVRKMEFFAPIALNSTLEHRIRSVLELQDALLVNGETIVNGKVVASYQNVTLAMRPKEQIFPKTTSERLKTA